MSDCSLPSDELRDSYSRDDDDGSSCVLSDYFPAHESSMCGSDVSDGYNSDNLFLKRVETAPSTPRKSEKDCSDEESSCSSSSSSDTGGRRQRNKLNLGCAACVFAVATLVLLGGSITATVIVFLSNPGLELDTSSLSQGGNSQFSDLPTPHPTDHFSPWKQLGVDFDSGPLPSSRSVSLSSDGTTVAISEANRTHSGEISTRIYRYSEFSKEWNKLGDDLEIHTNFTGRSACLSGDGTVVAIASYHSSDVDSGESENLGGIVRVYGLLFSEWVQLGSDIHTLESFNINDSFDWTIDLSSDASTLVIGAPGRNGQNSTFGEVLAFRWNGFEWKLLGTPLYGRRNGDRFGSGISLTDDGATLAVGAPGNGFGRVEVLKLLDDRWMQHGYEIQGDSGDESIGYDVSIDGDGETLAIGSPFADPNGENSGRVRVYLWSGIFWFPTGVFEGSEAGEKLGHSVSLSTNGETLAIGSPGYGATHGSDSGKVEIYEWKEPKWEARFDAIEGMTAEKDLGNFISISGDGTSLALTGTRDGIDGWIRVLSFP